MNYEELAFPRALQLRCQECEGTGLSKWKEMNSERNQFHYTTDGIEICAKCAGKGVTAISSGNYKALVENRIDELSKLQQRVLLQELITLDQFGFCAFTPWIAAVLVDLSILFTTGASKYNLRFVIKELSWKNDETL